MKALRLCVLLLTGFVLCIGVQGQATAEEKAEGHYLKVLEKMTFKGDLRLRHDTQWRDTGAHDYARNRERFRLRFGVKAELTDNTDVEVRLASGSGFQNTTNQSFDGHGRGKGIFIDLAYASWEPCDYFKITGGKHKNPLFTFPLVWDPDVHPEGLSETVKFDPADGFGVFANFGQWFIEELNLKEESDRDPTLLAYQLGLVVKHSKKVKFQIAGTYYDFVHFDTIKATRGDLGDTETFIGYNQEHSQQMIFDSNEELLNEFGCWELGAKLKVKDVLPVPFSVFGDYVVNADADVDELVQKGAIQSDATGAYGDDPADLLAYGGDDRDSGWLVGFDLGNKKKKGDWYAKYFYQKLEDYAFPAVFVDSDFHGGGTNNKGHYVQGRYLLTDNIQARSTFFLATEREDEAKDGQKDEDRIQLDIIINF
jgi:hypothetical protein